MIAHPSDTVAAFQESVNLLLRLHRLTLAQRDESDEAGSLHEQMETLWHAMTEVDQARVKGLSADLYTIGTNRETSHTRPSPPERFADEMRELTAKNAWGEILNRIREEEPALEMRDVAYARGICWAHLGMPNVAIEFLTETGRLHLLSASEEILLLTCYVHAGRAHEVVERAKDIRATVQHPLLLFKAAEVFSMMAEESRSEKAVEYRQAAIDCAERAFALLEGVRIDPDKLQVFNALAEPALFHLAFSYDQLGNREKALDACKRALEMSPESPDALMLYGFLTFDSFPDARRSEFIGSQRSQFIGESYDRLLADPSFSPQVN